jgi:glycosyltransferase involved in cell wall biosynthesis
MKIAALMLSGSDFYATRAKACFETWLQGFDAFQIHSFEPCDFLPITQVGSRDGEGSCFDKRMGGLKAAPDADWFLCCSDDNYVWADNLRAALSQVPTDKPAIVGAFVLNPQDGTKLSATLASGSQVFFPSGGAGYCLNKAALDLIVLNMPTLQSEWGSNPEGEDVFIGWAADKLEIEKIDNPAFHPSNPEQGRGLNVPADKVISLHWLTENQIRALHTSGAKMFGRSISLCMICGNEEGVILRCLESAKKAFDELCLVSAIGNRPADKTLYVAEKWCAENGKEFKGAHYENRLDLPHVDDFGAARNISFGLAGGDWLLWLDCDDYLDAINCARIREAVQIIPGDINGLYANYRTDKNVAEITRERLIRRGFGKWKNPIHETCEITGKTMDCPQIKVFHGDHRHKHQSSAARNAVILRRAVEDAPRHYFYLHTELKMLKDPEAAKYGRFALALDLEIEDRYLVLLNMSELVPEKRMEYLHEAARLVPHRREAFAYACKASIIDGRKGDAVSYFRMMDSLPEPSPLPWNHQSLWYGWARNALRIDCLRISGQDDQADKEHAEYMKDPDYVEGVKAP